MIELKDFRGKITPEADCVLEAESRASGKERQEIVREILHAYALQKIDAHSVLTRLLDAQGIGGESKPASGNRRES